MEIILDAELESYLNSGLWEGKAGAFGYQDRHGWLQIITGSESNVVGLPLELLQKMLQELDNTSSR
jgi:septum formation protein